MSQAAAEQRFAHLLQPIRDLTRNWNVDITNELENYLQEIESITVTFDGGRTKLNFAEAALLIQGTACVYSKKVEYLYTLVYQVLDLLANKKKLKQQSSKDEDGNEKDETDLMQNDEEEFLSLDDVGVSNNTHYKHDTSEQNTPVMQKVNMSLIPLTEAEKGDNPLLSNKGKMLGNRNDFKINMCEVHPLGSLLLDLSQLNLVDLSIQNKPSSTPAVPRAIGHTHVPQDENIESRTDEGAADADFSMADDAEPLDMPPCETQMDQPKANSPIRDQKDRQTKRKMKKNKNLIQAPQEELDSDPWSLLDPNEQSLVEKPFNKRKTFSVPPSLIQKTSKKRKRKSVCCTKKQPLMPLTEFCKKAFYSRSAQFPQNPLKVPVYIEFEDLFWTEYKRRQAVLKKEYKLLKHQSHMKDLSRHFLTEEERDDLPFGEFGDADCGVHEDDDDNDEPLPNLADVVLETADGIQNDPGTGESDHGLDDGHVISSYEELLQHHIEAYIANAQRFAQITDLTKRVAEWEEKILPVLDEQERRGPFDIHKSGTEVIRYLETHATTKKGDRIVLPSEKVPFKRICSNKPAYETCRLFLSCLQLANTYNVEISVQGTLEEAVDTMSVRLLSTTMQFEELEHYRVPSEEA